VLKSPRIRTRARELPRARGRPDLGLLRRLLSFVRPYVRNLVIATIGVVVASALGLVFPRIMGDLVDTVIGENADLDALNLTAVLLIGVFLAQAVFTFLQIYFLAAMGEGVVADLRVAAYSHLMTLPVAFFDSRKTGEITSRLTSDASVVQGAVSVAFASALSQGITLVGGVVLLFVISVELSVTVLAFLPIAIIAAAIFGRYLRRVSTQFQDALADANAGAEESIAAVRVVKWFSAEGVETDRYRGRIQTSYRLALRRARLRAIFSPLVTFVGLGTLSFVLWRGGRLVIAGDMTTGDLVSFLLYTLTVAGAIGTFAGLYGQLQEALGASQRIFELLDEENDLREPAAPKSLRRVEGRVTLDAVAFTYGDRDIQVLEGVDLDILPGEIVALVGPSGAGKSTLVQLIPRFYDTTKGTVCIDGVDVTTVTRAELRRSMAAVPQETQLFSGTITENLRVAKPEATDEELVGACEAANADEFITAFPDGYATIVGERGVKLSGGQRQRVAIARALLKDPRILILDEATSSLDSEAEALVQAALDRLMEGRTTVVIAHRLSTVRNADRIVVLDRGRIAEEGRHEELLAAGGLYSELHARQFRDNS
jgi:subfamily B ATP-binding cassette protein MsbA